MGCLSLCLYVCACARHNAVQQCENNGASSASHALCRRGRVLFAVPLSRMKRKDSQYSGRKKDSAANLLFVCRSLGWLCAGGGGRPFFLDANRRVRLLFLVFYHSFFSSLLLRQKKGRQRQAAKQWSGSVPTTHAKESPKSRKEKRARLLSFLRRRIENDELTRHHQ